MKDKELSRQLALAIGWDARDILVYHSIDRVSVRVRQHTWRVFDYKDWGVVGPLVKHYDIMIYIILSPSKHAGKWNALTVRDHIADSPQQAIALAVIDIERGKK